MKNVSISEDLHRRLKLRAVQDGRHMGEVVAWLIERWLSGDISAKLEPLIVDESLMTRKVNPGPSKETTTDAVSTKTQRRSTAPRPMPDLSKTAQSKGRMGR